VDAVGPSEKRADSPLDLARAAALAAGVEALASGPARVLASELRALLEDARGDADVVSLADERRKRE
jgi:hypothetical protein